jgi:hypothetical protein
MEENKMNEQTIKDKKIITQYLTRLANINKNKLTTYVITDRKDLYDNRRGTSVDCKNLSDAKAWADRHQTQQSSVMTIEYRPNMIGFAGGISESLLAFKEGNLWISI